jgi:hypothetical protein
MLAGGICEPAEPSGFSTGKSCSAADFESLSAPVPVATVLDNLTAYIPTALGSDETVGVLWFNAVNFNFELSCTIPAGSTSCTAAGPSATISAGTPIVFGAISGSATQVSFSYEMSTPGVTVAALSHRVTMHRFPS